MTPTLWKLCFPNFAAAEVACKSGAAFPIERHEARRALSSLQLLRNYVNRPLIINSAFRTPEHNAKIGGAPNSLHLEGRAFDIRATGVERLQLIYFARQCGFHGIGLSNTFVHLDTRPIAKPAFWEY